jgi:hypothetical protein
MRRFFLALAATALPVSLLVGTPAAQAAELEYVALNSKGLKQTLIKKSWGPLWLGKVGEYDYNVSEKGSKPVECVTKGKTVKGEKSASFAEMKTVFEQNKDDHYLDIAQFVYQYDSVQAAEFAWQDLQNKAGTCAGTHVHPIKDASGTKIGEATVVITVSFRSGMYGQQQIVINEDVQYDKPLPGGADTVASSDEISIWSYDGMVIMEVEANKYVPKQKNFVFSDPQVRTIETLALVTLQRYHLAALKAL